MNNNVHDGNVGFQGMTISTELHGGRGFDHDNQILHHYHLCMVESIHMELCQNYIVQMLILNIRQNQIQIQMKAPPIRCFQSN